ncbi:DNA repair protein RecO [Candidatus Woesebacteria bacterium RIFCSPLOWO2_01_FULL_39_61]|uniref:DNA repair protein RecO n=1 Tax=Candidatus Woesebacteria bacterium RIFCSPHIGHO2_02_FULL_39_13 TaxID=1802505 RepID=A0A1F7Z1P0_9BACT|nr:MAG: DNA repair protein RecO [Candidatus Woesebacteria bacterium RIFCSPHIGHO2_01_FULL_39_95]OGM32635.1 MAG: DNA repair protein RecO [Candidatus Woesebacteria bacterium RIFCSPHIGHO2_02_FULL_39_13]OGM36432.1 MAG: DNA repair protein RecO [Candidatus Woesebacteria bacterium RIFCSPHIGHO2_12_FULL_40_20]OGM66703.1 MAG: DNA repair protein RecO [Candidatus Woesebacteria bacterium RIFCSPLOWO2_01_FULL_39_61]OGM73774.1 MAG: DNA repair protein RecO [Candidatus Woesebacteria bacterium RIFCSPLOWO2_12_FULL_
MRVKYYSSEGIVLAKKNYSEADRIIILLTRNWGKLHILAKGVRKPISKKRGSLEIFSRIRFSASQTKGLALITEVEIIDSFNSIRANLKKVAVAYFFMEVLGRVLHEGERHNDVYEITLSYIDKLRCGVKLGKLRADFIYKVLVSLGFWPKGKEMNNPDLVLEEVIERKVNSIRVGKRLLS